MRAGSLVCGASPQRLVQLDGVRAQHGPHRRPGLVVVEVAAQGRVEALELGRVAAQHDAEQPGQHAQLRDLAGRGVLPARRRSRGSRRRPPSRRPSRRAVPRRGGRCGRSGCGTGRPASRRRRHPCGEATWASSWAGAWADALPGLGAGRLRGLRRRGRRSRGRRAAGRGRPPWCAPAVGGRCPARPARRGASCVLTSGVGAAPTGVVGDRRGGASASLGGGGPSGVATDGPRRGRQSPPRRPPRAPGRVRGGAEHGADPSLSLARRRRRTALVAAWAA